MTDFRQIMTDVINGRPALFLPFVPRLDVWYHSHKRRGDLPPEYKNAALFDILDDLDIGFNTMIPDYLNHAGRSDQLHRGLGFHPTNTADVFTLDFPGIPVSDSWEGDNYKVSYKTPHGELTTISRLDQNMMNQGSTIAVTVKKLLQSADDFKAATYLFSRARVSPDYERYNRFKETIGRRGLATAFVCQRESGYRMLNMDLMTYEDALFAEVDHPLEHAALCQVLDAFLERCVALAIDSPADVLTVGAHFDTGLTPPYAFSRHTCPRLQKYSQQIAAARKKMASHTDSENNQLLPLYLKSGISILDSICQEPLTSLSYRKIREITGDQATLYGLIPSITLLKSSFSDYEFAAFLDNLFSQIQADGARNIILAVADTTPPGAELDRIRQIAMLSRQIKPV